MIKRVLFFHNAPMPYRLPLFNEIAKSYPTKFYFTDLQIAKRRYDFDINNIGDGLGSLDYMVLDGLKGRLESFLKPLRQDYDVLIDSLEAPSILTFIPARIRNKRTIYWSEELGWGNLNMRVRLGLIIKKYVARNCNTLIVPGTKHRDYFLGLGVPEDRIIIAPNATDTNLWGLEEVNIREKFNLANKKIILYVGRLIKRKGVEDLIRAFAYAPPDSTLIIVGRGEMESTLVKLATDLGINERVIFAGYVPDCQLSSYYRSADVCVVPSRGERMLDPWVFVVNEAMHFGVPVIATNAVGAANDMIINGQTGFIIPEGDVPSLSKALNEILRDNVISEKMGHNAQKLEEELFSYKRMKDMFCIAIEGRN